MSATASFFKLPKTAVDGLRRAAVPQKRLFRAPRDVYYDYLRQHGQIVADYEWSGYVLATLLPCLEEQHHILLMNSAYDALAAFLTESRGATHFVLTNEHQQAFLSKLDGQFSEQALCDYFNEFNESQVPDAGRMMLDGISALRQSIASVDDRSVVIFIID